MQTVKKVWLYIVRTRNAAPELLVFEHTHVDAGIQIPAGTVEPGEGLTHAAQRELFEESGVRVERLMHLGERKREWNGEWVHAHWFCGYAPNDAADDWLHHVSGSGQDKNMTFRCYWLPQTEWETLCGDFKCALAALEQSIPQIFMTGTK